MTTVVVMIMLAMMKVVVTVMKNTAAPRGGGISAETLHENMAVSSVEVHFHGGLKHGV